MPRRNAAKLATSAAPAPVRTVAAAISRAIRATTRTRALPAADKIPGRAATIAGPVPIAVARVTAADMRAAGTAAVALGPPAAADSIRDPVTATAKSASGR